MAAHRQHQVQHCPAPHMHDCVSKLSAPQAPLARATAISMGLGNLHLLSRSLMAGLLHRLDLCMRQDRFALILM